VTFWILNCLSIKCYYKNEKSFLKIVLIPLLRGGSAADGVDCIFDLIILSIMKNEKWKEKALYNFWDLPKNIELINRSRELRKAGVLSEVIFWQTFKKKNTFNWDIDRQVIIGNYIVDFFIPELGLIFEIDGSTHNFKIDYDKERDNFFESFGLKVVHIRDSEVFKQIDKVFEFVKICIEDRVKFLEGRLKASTPSAKADTPQRGELRQKSFQLF